MRNYNIENQDHPDHKYTYNFDLDVIHPYIIESLKNFFINGSMLELGSNEGNFTKHLLEHFSDITCIEASSDAIDKAKKKLINNKINYFNSTFENVKLNSQFDNIVMTHVLEHIAEPALVLDRIYNEWLSDEGKFFLVCPNANAPSRQIAVKMGIIPNNFAVTDAEKAHGHFRTYSLDTLERDAVNSGFKVIYRSGIFFKGLANFQWDKVLESDIVSKDYLDGCFKLGQIYPDLCSSIFVVCVKSK